MQLRVAGRQPRGWEQVVARINALDDFGTFQQQMLELQCKIVAAEYGVLWQVREKGGTQIDTAAVWPSGLSPEGQHAQVLQAMRQSAQSVLARGLSQVMMLRPDQSGADSGDDRSVYIFATLMRRDNKPAAVSTVVADCHDTQVITATAPARELAAGLYDSFSARLEAKAESNTAKRIREAMALLAVTQEAKGFRGACMNMANELARVLHCERVSVGWVKHGTIKLTAVSDADHVKRHTEQVAQLEVAMAECLDQEQPLMYPVPQEAEDLFARSVCFSHKAATEGKSNTHILSIPLRDRDEQVGVLTLERQGEPFDSGTIQRLQMTADVVAPQLHDRYNSDRWLAGHAWQSVQRGAGYLVGPQHVGWKMLGIAVLAVLLYLAFGTWNYSINAPFAFEAHERRAVSVMYEGRVDQVLVEPGDKVQAGELLAQLDTRELNLQRIEIQGMLHEAEIARNQARSQGELAEVAKATAKTQQLNARLDLLNDRIHAASIRSPVDGVVLAGYWHDKVGRVVEQGDAMFEIAPLEQLIAVLNIDESDFHALADVLETNQGSIEGRLATRAEPRVHFPIYLQRIVPVAKADTNKGVNVFEAWCAVEDPAPWLRPGMEGKAKLDAGRRPIAWILSHKLIDTVRLWLWW